MLKKGRAEKSKERPKRNTWWMAAYFGIKNLNDTARLVHVMGWMLASYPFISLPMMF